MRLLAILALVFGSCSTEGLRHVADLAEAQARAEIEADVARIEADQARAELEAARVDGTRDAAELELLEQASAAAAAAATEAEAAEQEAELALEAAKARSAAEFGAAGDAAGALVPGARPLIPLAGALILWGAAALGNARAAKKQLQQKGGQPATGPPGE